ncbi:MAG: FemAB family XrtA/PEP-CTERM system-associated protein [Gammaproteobacteria bacterium]
MQETSESPVTVHIASDADAARWNGFVDAAPTATFFHRYEWTSVLRRAFGHRSYYLYAERDGQIEGILPLAHVNSRLFSNALISTPFCVYGGVVATNDDAYRELLARGCALADELGVDYLECRNMVAREPSWPSKDLYVTFQKDISPDSETNLLAIPKKQRAMVRKGIKAGLTATVENDVSTLYRCYSESVRNLGTPVFGKKYLEVLADVFGDDCQIMVIRNGDSPVAAVMSFFFRNQVLPYYGGGTLEARAVKGNDFMYWSVMESARERGLTLFDFGRSKVDTGAYRFKKHWGFEPQPMSYEYYLSGLDSMPDLSPNNPKYKLFIGLWQKLPLGISQRLGPWLARSLG